MNALLDSLIAGLGEILSNAADERGLLGLDFAMFDSAPSTSRTRLIHQRVGGLTFTAQVLA